MVTQLDTAVTVDLLRLNLGCGRDIRPGWVNLDSHPAPGVGIVVDLDDHPVLPLADDSVSHSEGSHVLEHLQHPLPFMAELWRVTRPGGTVTFRTPYGSSDDADEDPTHVRRLYVGSWLYFSQPAYWRADYGYRADWRTETVTLHLWPQFADKSNDEMATLVHYGRNVVAEMVATLSAVKPARDPARELQEPYDLILQGGVPRA